MPSPYIGQACGCLVMVLSLLLPGSHGDPGTVAYVGLNVAGSASPPLDLSVPIGKMLGGKRHGVSSEN